MPELKKILLLDASQREHVTFLNPQSSTVIVKIEVQVFNDQQAYKNIRKISKLQANLSVNRMS